MPGPNGSSYISLINAEAIRTNPRAPVCLTTAEQVWTATYLLPGHAVVGWKDDVEHTNWAPLKDADVLAWLPADIGSDLASSLRDAIEAVGPHSFAAVLAAEAGDPDGAMEARERGWHGRDVQAWFVERGVRAPHVYPVPEEQPKVAAASRILPSAEFVAGFKPPDYVLDGILQRGFCYSLTAVTGSGKTAITLLLMAHVALGRPLSGHQVQRGPVLMLAGENADDVRMRWIALAEQAGFDAAEIDVHFMPGVFSIQDSFPEIQAKADEIGGLSLISVDTSAAYFLGQDENSNTELGDHARMLRQLTSLPGSPCVVANCHPVKNAAADNLLPRGGGAFLNEVDGNLVCTKQDSVVTLSWQGKFRGPEFEPMPFELVPVTSPRLVDSQGKAVPTVVARTITEFEEEMRVQAGQSDARTILRLINDQSGGSISELAERAGWLTKDGSANKSKMQRVLNRLRHEKFVTHHLNQWELTPSGLRALKVRAPA